MAPLYEDKDYLKLLDDDLRELACETKIDLPDGLDSRERARRISQILAKKTRQPHSFDDVFEFLLSDRFLLSAIHSQLKKRNPHGPALYDLAEQAGRLEDIESTVATKTGFSLVSNAGNYHRRMVRAEELLAQHRELFQRILEGLQVALRPLKTPTRMSEIKALAVSIGAILKESPSMPPAWREVQELAAIQDGQLNELAGLLGWDATDVNLLIAQICDWLMNEKKLTWRGWIYTSAYRLTMRVALKLLPLGEHVGGFDEDRDFYGGLADRECKDPHWILDTATFDKPWVSVKVLADAAPYGVAWLAVQRNTTREGLSQIGKRLIALAKDQSARHVRQARILLREVVGDFNGHCSSLNGHLLPADDDILDNQPSLFKFEQVRELLQTGEVQGDDELKNDVIRLLEKLKH